VVIGQDSEEDGRQCGIWMDLVGLVRGPVPQVVCGLT
jgi:hypothetical protein